MYREFLSLLGVNPADIIKAEHIPHIPVSFFKTHALVSSPGPYEAVFRSSGTSGANTSTHFVKNLSLYRKLARHSFEHFYGSLRDYIILALLPGYLERKDSSLVSMIADFIENSGDKNSGFYLHNRGELAEKLVFLDQKKEKKILLIGVTHALLDLLEVKRFGLKNTIVMETGGMKGKRKELTRKELHEMLKDGFGVKTIHSEYGMTEMLSQAYSSEKGLFYTPPWVRIYIRDVSDPFTWLSPGKTGAVSVTDLANINSASFISLDDLGRQYENGSFEISGRLDNSDIRGCNLLTF